MSVHWVSLGAQIRHRGEARKKDWSVSGVSKLVGGGGGCMDGAGMDNSSYGEGWTGGRVSETVLA